MHAAVSGDLGWSRVSGLGGAASTLLIPQFIRSNSTFLLHAFYFCVYFAEIRYMEARPSSSLPLAAAPAAVARASSGMCTGGRGVQGVQSERGALFVVGRVVVASCMCVG